MVVGVLKLTLFIPENHSLKGKRGVLNKIKARVANSFNVSIAECDDQDLWQRASIGVVSIASDQKVLEQILQSVEKESYAVLGRDLVGIQREVFES